jgi:hypothetical protein
VRSGHLEAGGRLENAQAFAAPESPRKKALTSDARRFGGGLDADWVPAACAKMTSPDICETWQFIPLL